MLILDYIGHPRS